ncbi:MAG: heme lyase CcmF/NrfE family subunit [Alphaproteobacteria bacterium]|jgi:cytochrome c-type biogenesis protein CcmF|nr:heme lyase CcmF/NrfE family subunit [Alphaproteobacteria bacterium]
MIAEIGHFALVLALFAALVQASVPMVGAARGEPRWMALGVPAAIAQFALLLVAFGALTHAYVTSDFSLRIVAANSNSLKPLIYKISGVWGNHEGSMLLWVLILALFGSMVALFGRNLPPTLKARVLSVQALVALGFLLFILLTSNPFDRLFPAPADGRGLNPLLQDPGLAFHPPILYTGYVGFSMAFSFAVAALIEGKVDAAWARWVRPWTLVAWAFLTAGIALGSWWAYYELGWGGWWFWDPVENASFMPWLVGTALLHSAIVVEKRDALKSWTILLAIITFSLSLIGTFLVRSGVLTSVHAFATDPGRGVFILMLLVIAIGGSLALFAWRAPQLQAGGLFQPVSREGALVLNNLLLTTAAATVLLGTLYPLLLEAITGDKVSVGAPFFNMTFVPLMVPLVAAIGIGPLLAWKRADIAGAVSRLKFAGALTVAAVAVVLWASESRAALGAMGVGLAVWLAASGLNDLARRIGLGRMSLGHSLSRAVGLPRASWGMTVAHLGLAIAVAGVTGASLWETESIQIMKPGDQVNVAGYDIAFVGVEDLRGPNYLAERGTFTVAKDGERIAILQPEKRRYVVSRQDTTEAAIRTTGIYDLYLVLGENNGKGGWTTRFYHKPLVPWLWIGSLVMVLGGLISLSDRRLRVGAPSRRPKRGKGAAAAPAAAE